MRGWWSMSPWQDNISTVAAIYEAFTGDDVPAILDKLADDVSMGAGNPQRRTSRTTRPGVGKAQVV